jgi:hypothetical protein
MMMRWADGPAASQPPEAHLMSMTSIFQTALPHGSTLSRRPAGFDLDPFVAEVIDDFTPLMEVKKLMDTDIRSLPKKPASVPAATHSHDDRCLDTECDVDRSLTA